jgi:hypothetical protein
VTRSWAERRARHRLSSAEHARDVVSHRRTLLRSALAAALEAQDRPTAEDLVGRIRVLDKEFKDACDEVRLAKVEMQT